jgi:hypothetical protein
MRAELITVIVTIVVLVGVVALRTFSGGRVQVTLNDAIIAAIAAGLTLLVSGFVTKLVVGPEGVTIETARQAILSASARKIDKQVTPLPVAQFDEVLKGGLSQLPSIVQRRVQGIDFVLGGGGYVPDIVRQYLETLGQQPSFKGFVLVDFNGKMIAVIDGRSLQAFLTRSDSGMTYGDFTAFLNRGNSDDLTRLSHVPGFVPAKDAVSAQTDKRAVLEKMEKAGMDWWPVVDPDGKLAGTVDRARLVSSLILDVTDQLRSGGSAHD